MYASMPYSSTRGTGRALRIALAAGLTLLLLWWSDPADVARVALGADWRWLAAAIGLVTVDRGLMAWRWIVLLPPDVLRQTAIWPLLRIFFVSTFVGTFLPGSVGGDAVRAWQLSSSPNVRGAIAVASVVMDRLLGVAALIMMAGAGALAMGQVRDDPRLTLAILVTAAAAIAGTFAVLSERVAVVALRWMGWLPEAISRGAAGVLDALRAYRARRGVVVSVLAASVLVNVLRILQAWMLGRGLSIDAPLGAYFAFVPVILLIMLLPISINGIGTSQAGFVFFFARAGVPEAESFALSVLYLGLGLLGNVPGGFLFATRQKAAAAGR
jgi:uncharacterized protein (TIRG00374 family)